MPCVQERVCSVLLPCDAHLVFAKHRQDHLEGLGKQVREAVDDGDVLDITELHECCASYGTELKERSLQLFRRWYQE